MSVGLSQVDFDPKAIEDEDEAALDKEDQEREQEIRKLLADELDDDLLDEDNASFSSHDLRSTTNSRASQPLDDSLNLPQDSDSNEMADFPPRRGVYEKPPLMTQKGSNLINQSATSMQTHHGFQYVSYNNQNTGHYQDTRHLMPHPGDPGTVHNPPLNGNNYHGYHDDVEIGSYSPDTNSNEEQYNENGYEYNDHYGANHQGSYHSDPNSFHGDQNSYNGDQGSYHGDQDNHHDNQGSYHGNQESYHGYQDGYHGDDQNGNHGKQDSYHGDHGTYHGDQGSYYGSQGSYHGNDYPFGDESIQFHSYHEDQHAEHSSSSKQGGGEGLHKQDVSQTPSFPGNYRVQYVPGYKPKAAPYQDQVERSGQEDVRKPVPLPGQSGPNTVWRDMRQQTDKDSSPAPTDPSEYGGSQKPDTQQSTNAAQLQVLYQARGRKIEELNNKLQKQEEELGRQIRVLNHQLMMVKDEHAGMATSLEQAQQIAQQSKQDISRVEDKLEASQKKISQIQQEKQQTEEMLHTANSTIDSLNEQLSQMTRADALTKAREQHESILNAARKRQEEEILRLKQKLDESRLSLDWKTEESNRLRDEVLEKGDIINRLTKTLDDTQRQCQELVRTGTVAEVTSLRSQLRDALGARATAEKSVSSFKNEVTDLQEQLSVYQNALKYGFGGDAADASESFSVARNLDAESWATPKPNITNDSQQAVDGLRRELGRSMEMVSAKAERIKKLEAEVADLQSMVEQDRQRAERMEKLALEHEKKVQQLETELQSKSSGQGGANEAIIKEMEQLRQEQQDYQHKLDKLTHAEQELEEENKNLRQHMAEMVKEFDQDKQTSLEKCREACLQLHEDSKARLRTELESEHQKAIKELSDSIEEKNDELIRVKECYIQLREESRTAEQIIRQEMEKEREHLLSKEMSEAVKSLKSTLTARHEKELEAARESWQIQHSQDVENAVKEAIEKAKEQEKQKQVESLQAAVHEMVATAKEEWIHQELAGQVEQRLSEARVRWEAEAAEEVKSRVREALKEEQLTWEEEHREKLRQEVDAAVAETKASVTKIHKEQFQRDLDLALLDARASWQRSAEETSARDIEQEIEVAVTNAVAEARSQWEKEAEINKGVTSRTTLAKEKLQWRAEEAAERQRAIEAAVALAEVDWLEEEQRKISTAVDEALWAARDTWDDKKQRDIARAVADARQEWASTQEQEVTRALETAHSELVDEFDQRTREAVEMAVMQAKALWQRNHDNNNNNHEKEQNIESIKDKLWAEFEEAKEDSVREALDSEREKWRKEYEKTTQDEINKTISYLEDQYTRGLEEFKHKELREALAQARADWEKEREVEIDELLQSRLESERHNWSAARDQATQIEIDRALVTAREAWAANYHDEMEERVSSEVSRVREEVASHAEMDKEKAVNEAIKDVTRKLELEKKKLREELKRLKATQSPEKNVKRWEEECKALRNEHENELQRVREESARDAQEDAERELEQRLPGILQEAKQQWEEELEEERVQLEEQHQKKIASLLEKAKQEHTKEREQAVQAACERAVKQQQQLWMNERKKTQSSLDRIKQEMTRVQQKHVNTIEALKREHAEEMSRIRDEASRQVSILSDAPQTPRGQESTSDTSFGSVDQLTAARGLHELRHQYLDTVAKIRDDVLDHVKQTKISAAKKIRAEVTKERHSTAKKLRKYYIQCLKQLLEEDKAASDSDQPITSVQDKMERMARALEAASPDVPSKDPTTQPKILKSPSKKIQIPRTTQSTSKDDPSQTNRLGEYGPHITRPGEYGPDGESDSPRPSPSDKILNDSIMDKYEELDKESKKRIDSIMSKGQPPWDPEHANRVLPEREDNTPVVVTHTKPLSVQGRSVASTISVTSNESDYTELPTVIHSSPTRDSGSLPRARGGQEGRPAATKSALGEIKARVLGKDSVKSPSVKQPVLQGLKARNARVDKYGSRDNQGVNGTPPLPSRPIVKMTSQGDS
ncbi:centrosomal protein of 152 kDa isoform X2 [Nematostella vectensis]|uniref:centrosomal protein of 152 kDa isoform X2 n=1 Tax=Nematostella vectensis TaxID=45351 RepID=UPI0020775381|nr:centrosomal protein of 152 kDa isoform X2 [Nematostella vectensis]